MSIANLAGKVALVTGGSKGIGRATCLALNRAGANVVVNYGSDSAAANDLVSEIGKDKALAVQADAGTIAGAEKMIAETVQKYGKIDILIPNAGVLPMKTIHNTSEEDFDKTFALNVKGPYFLVQKALPHMAEGSRIILVSSSVAHASIVSPPYLLYCSTKGAIEQMGRVLAKDLASKGILVNTVAPGPTSTELFLRGKSEALLKTVAGFSPMNRIGQPEEIADTFVYLSGDASRWVTGQVVMVNGGMC